MVGILRIALVVIAALGLASSASAFGWRSGGSSSSWSSSSYYYVPVYYWYYCPPVPVYAVPSAGTIYARPTAAPPSQTSEPPLQKMLSDPRVPAIITSRSAPTPSTSERCRVGFWNISGRDVTLTVDGKSWTLARNRSVTVETGRQFAWRIDQEAERKEQVADGAATHEVLLR